MLPGLAVQRRFLADESGQPSHRSVLCLPHCAYLMCLPSFRKGSGDFGTQISGMCIIIQKHFFGTLDVCGPLDV